MKIPLAVASVLILLTWACSPDVNVHGIPDSIELTGCGDLIPGLGAKDAGPKDAGRE